MTLLQALDRHDGGDGGGAQGGEAGAAGGLLEFVLRATVPSAVIRAVVREDVLDADVGLAQAEAYAGLWREVGGFVCGWLVG